MQNFKEWNFLKQKNGCLKKNLIARLINHHTNFQIFNIQIPENIFSQMLKAWIDEDFLHFLKPLVFLRYLKDFSSLHFWTDMVIAGCRSVYF